MLDGVSGASNNNNGNLRNIDLSKKLDVKSFCIWLDANGNNNNSLDLEDINIVEKSAFWDKLPDIIKNFTIPSLLSMIIPDVDNVKILQSTSSPSLNKNSIDLDNNVIDKQLPTKSIKEENGKVIVTEVISINEGMITERVSEYNAETKELIGLSEKEYSYNNPVIFIENVKNFDPKTGEILNVNNRESRIKLDGSVAVSIYNYQPINGIKCKARESSFEYNREAMENYVINAKDSPHFSDINIIRSKSEDMLTEEEKNKLAEFNNMIDNVIDAGIEYGVDPNRILSIIQQETKFNGLSPKATGDAGKGYMQITSSPVLDIMGLSGNVWGESKYQKYGHEVNDLLQSRGFDTNCTLLDKPALCKSIMNYLKKNKDPEFNIKLGTLILRRYLDKYDGNMSWASWGYNGNASASKTNGKPVQENYRESVNRYCNELRRTVVSDSLYKVNIVPLADLNL